MFLIPQVAYAAPGNIDVLVRAINQFVINPIIIILFLLALVYFFYGVFVAIKDSKSSEGRAKGGQHMMWGLIGVLIMISVFFILRVLMTTFGVNNINLEPGPDQSFVEIDPNFLD